MEKILARIVAPHFVAGLVLRDGNVQICAPIVKYMKGWTRDRVRDYCVQKGWEIKIVPSKKEGT